MKLQTAMAWGVGCLSAGLVVSATAQAEPTPREDAADAVVGVFFDRASAQADATPRDPEDDARVDRWMAHCAALAGGRPEVQAALYRRLVDRTSRRGDAAEALNHWLAFAKAQPRHPATASAQRVARYAQAYDAVARDRDARTPLAEPYIEALLDHAQRRERAWAIADASAAVGEAMSVARTNHSPYREVLDSYARTLETLERESQRLDQLRQRVEAGRATLADARAVTLRLACDRSDIPGAIAAAPLVQDEQLVRVLRYAAMDPNELEPLQSLAVAEMFRSAADDSALTLDRARLNAMMEAQFYYQHFLFAYTGHDVIRLRAQDAAQALTLRIDALRPAPLRRPPGSWRTLTNNLTEPRVGNRGNLIRGSHLRVRNHTVYAHESSFSIPAVINESYDMRIVIKRAHANDRRGMSLYFPVGNTGARLRLGEGGDNGSQLDRINLPLDLPGNFRFPEDTPVTLELAVRQMPGGRAHITIALGGRPCLEWDGPIKSIATDQGRPPRSHGNIFAIAAGTTYEFSQIQIRRAGEE